jgi:hypothetical protein
VPGYFVADLLDQPGIEGGVDGLVHDVADGPSLVTMSRIPSIMLR